MSALTLLKELKAEINKLPVVRDSSDSSNFIPSLNTKMEVSKSDKKPFEKKSVVDYTEEDINELKNSKRNIKKFLNDKFKDSFSSDQLKSFFRLLLKADLKKMKTNLLIEEPVIGEFDLWEILEEHINDALILLDKICRESIEDKKSTDFTLYHSFLAKRWDTDGTQIFKDALIFLLVKIGEYVKYLNPEEQKKHLNDQQSIQQYGEMYEKFKQLKNLRNEFVHFFIYELKLNLLVNMEFKKLNEKFKLIYDLDKFSSKKITLKQLISILTEFLGMIKKAKTTLKPFKIFPKNSKNKKLIYTDIFVQHPFKLKIVSVFLDFIDELSQKTLNDKPEKFEKMAFIAKIMIVCSAYKDLMDNQLLKELIDQQKLGSEDLSKKVGLLGNTIRHDTDYELNNLFKRCLDFFNKNKYTLRNIINYWHKWEKSNFFLGRKVNHDFLIHEEKYYNLGPLWQRPRALSVSSYFLNMPSIDIDEENTKLKDSFKP